MSHVRSPPKARRVEAVGGSRRGHLRLRRGESAAGGSALPTHPSGVHLSTKAYAPSMEAMQIIGDGGCDAVTAHDLSPERATSASPERGHPGRGTPGTQVRDSARDPAGRA